jgi:hypothetical protein
MKHLVQQLLRDRPVAYHPLLAKLVGGATTGLFLSQILYWSDKGSDPEGWIYKTMQELQEETGLTRREQETARQNLTNKNVLEVQRRGVPARLYYRINWEVLIQLLSDYAEQTRLAESAKLDCTKPPNWIGGFAQSSYTESTAESTASLSPGLESTVDVAASHVADGTPRERENLASHPRKRALAPAPTEPPAVPDPPDGGTTSPQRTLSPAPTEPSPASAAALLSAPERRAIETALTQEGCTLRQTAALLTQYTPDQVRALLAQATERRRAGERNGGMWRSAARGEWVPDMQAGTPPPDPAGERAARQAAAYREEVAAWQQAAETAREENRQALEQAKSRLPWQQAGSTDGEGK